MDEVNLTLDDPAGWAAKLNATLPAHTAVKRARPISLGWADLLLNGTPRRPATLASGAWRAIRQHFRKQTRQSVDDGLLGIVTDWIVEQLASRPPGPGE
ncbi:MAG: hypothetical protein M3Y77_19820 [Actinomycetota bacterium]|nr:hypothetical protein [Actinomycetota bacterium]